MLQDHITDLVITRSAYTELYAYQAMTGTVLNAWQVKMLMRIDQIFLAASAKAQQIKANTPMRAKR